MTVDQIRAINRTTEDRVAALRAGETLDATGAFPYYGYVDVDMFDCPPFVMFTNNDSPVVGYILRNGTFEPGSMAVWCALARVAGGIVDAGANVGIYSLCAAGLRPDLSVHAFEPNPYAYARLRVNKFINRFDNLVEHQVGLGKAGTFPMTWTVKEGGNISSGGGFGERPGITETIDAKAIVLDDHELVSTLGDHPLLKIDVEGAETAVFKGLTKVLARRPDIILETFKQTACNIINDIVVPLGYTAYGIKENAMTLEARDKLIPAEISSAHNLNQLLTVRPRAELERLLPPEFTIVHPQ